MLHALRLIRTTSRPQLRASSFELPRPPPCRNASRKARTAKVPPVKAKAEPAPQIQLRSYQEECIQSVLSSLKLGQKRLGVSLATGSGKTVIFTQLIDRVSPPDDRADRTLILAHRRELVEQAAGHCARAYPDKSVEIEMANMRASGTADITVASVQSIGSGERLQKYDPARFKLVLVDEAHHIVAPQYIEVLDHFGLKDTPTTENGPALIGVSATFSRFDGKQLGQVIDHIVYHRDYVDMIEEKWLTDVMFTTVESKADIRNVGTGVNGDFNTSALSNAVNNDESNEITVRAWMAKASERKSTLVFCVDLDHVSRLTATFRRYGYEAHFITGDTPKKVRGDRLDAFRRGEFPVLLNCAVFTEGTDIPNIDCVLLARPTKSRNLLVQMIGRGMRLHKDKANCHVIDMVASLNTGIVSTPTLFGLDANAAVDGASVAELKELKDRKEAEAVREEAARKVEAPASGSAVRPGTTIEFTDYDSVTDLLEDTVEERIIHRLSQFSWVGVGDGCYVLSTRSGSYLKLEPDGDKYKVKLVSRLPPGAATHKPFARPRQIVSAETFDHAVRAADTYAGENFDRFYILRYQAWRKYPASPAQVEYLNKFRDEDDQLTTSDITKGQATDMITKVKHGARGRYKRIEVHKRASAREQVKADSAKAMSAREQVVVGPLSKAVSGKRFGDALSTT